MSALDELEDDDQIQRVVPDEQAPPYTPPLPAGGADTPVSLFPQLPASEMSNSDLLKGYFGGGISPSDDPQYAEIKKQAAQNKLYAQLGEAADTVGTSIGRRPDLQDPTFYRNLAKDADAPVKDYVNSRALVQKYLANKLKNENDQKRIDVAEKRASEMERHNQEMEGIASKKGDTAGSEKQNMLDTVTHRQNLRQAKANPTLAKTISQYNALDNSLALVANAKKLTPEQIAEFQQSVRSNLGIKGQSGIGEREETQMHTMGLNAARFREFITGDPVAISKDSHLVQHLQDLAHVEQKNIKNQYQKGLTALTAGHGSMYARRPDLKQDLEDYIQAQSDRLGGNEALAGAQAAQIPAPGLTAPHPQDSEAVQWAKANPNNPKAAKILQLNGAN